MAATQVKAEAAHRDAGLVREIGVWAFAAAIVNVVVGGGIFAAPAALAASVGAWAPIALLACGIAMGAIVLCCAEAGSRVPSSGGTYAYVEAAFGPAPGFVAGMMLWLSCVLAAGGIAAAFADAIVALYPVGSPIVQRVALIVETAPELGDEDAMWFPGYLADDVLQATGRLAGDGGHFAQYVDECVPCAFLHLDEGGQAVAVGHGCRGSIRVHGAESCR